MDKPKVLLLDLKSYYPSPPYQLGLLVAYANTCDSVRDGVDFMFSEHEREVPVEEIAATILALKVTLIAASNYSWNHKKLTQVLDILSASADESPLVVIGGPNCSGQVGEELLRQYPIINALVEGEGEPAFYDICQALVNRKGAELFEEARNCTIINDKGLILRSNAGHRMSRLDEVPSPYLTGILPVKPSPIFYETNRGCPYRCSFCYWGNGNAKVYRMSLERVKEEMTFFAKNKVHAFWLADANFGIFPTDADIAKMMVAVNEEYGYPFRSVGVNWAKNSSDRILEIASIFRKGKIATSTTIALQTITPKAEKLSKRYAIPPVKFMHLLKSAADRDIDTYTDIILGLPGETLAEFINGLSIVSSTTVPSIKIHQLVLIPATEFYDNKEEFGLKVIPELITEEVAITEKSDYYDCTVISHPELSQDDMVRGRYFMGIVHLLHNNNLGRVVNLFLNRYGLSNEVIFQFMEEVLLHGSPFLAEEGIQPFLDDLRALLRHYANKHGVDDNEYFMELSFKLWFKEKGSVLKEANNTEVRRFVEAFYTALCQKYNCCQRAEEQQLLRELIAYNMLVSPKPTWKPAPEYHFTFDVKQVYEDMEQAVLTVTEDLEPLKKRRDETVNAWQQFFPLIQKRLEDLLTERYITAAKKNNILKVTNPWRFAPAKKNIDWMISTRSKHCSVQAVYAIVETK